MITKSFLNVWSSKNFQNCPTPSGLLYIAESQGVLFSCSRTLSILKARPGNGESVMLTNKKKKKKEN